MQIFNDDCLNVLRTLPPDSIDLVLTDPPYGLTDCEWDKALDWAAIWPELNRVVKANGNIAIFCGFPFTVDLIASNRKNFRYCWTWKRNNVTNWAVARYAPMRNLEHIAVFYNRRYFANTTRYSNLRRYFLDELARSGLRRCDINKMLNSYMSSHYFTMGEQFGLPTPAAYKKLQATGFWPRSYESIKAEFDAEPVSQPPLYQPQGVRKLDKPRFSLNGGRIITEFKRSDGYMQEYTGYPTELLEFKAINANQKLHTSEKPQDLLEYLIKTYTKEGETVLDFCAGGGSTGVAAVNLNRNFIGAELDAKFFAIAKDRIETAQQKQVPLSA